MHLYTRDGLRVLVRVELPHFPFSCTDSSYLGGLANGTKGRIGLAPLPFIRVALNAP